MREISKIVTLTARPTVCFRVHSEHPARCVSIGTLVLYVVPASHFDFTLV